VEAFKEGVVLFMRFADGEDLLETMKLALGKHGIRSGVVLGGVGMLTSPGLSFYKGKGTYEAIPLDEEVELCALNGNVATVDGEIFVHLHATVGRSDGRAMAGHLSGGKVHMTAEVAVRALDKQMVRVLDAGTGLRTLRFG
jgi:predicted DNA-binding protein with PD1-like motif